MVKKKKEDKEVKKIGWNSKVQSKPIFKKEVRPTIVIKNIPTSFKQEYEREKNMLGWK